MKMVTLAIAAVLMTASAAQAQWGGGHRRGGGWGGGGYHRGGGWDRGHRGDGEVVVGVGCAPEVVEGNVVATDKTLSKVAATPEFANATAFKAELARIKAVKSADARAAQYFQLIGIDASNTDQVAAFVGARDVSATQLSALEKSTGLTSAQADTVATSLQSALRGNLQ